MKKHPPTKKTGTHAEKILKKIETDMDDSMWPLVQLHYHDRVELTQTSQMAFIDKTILSVSADKPYKWMDITITEMSAQRALDINIGFDKTQAIAFAHKILELAERLT